MTFITIEGIDGSGKSSVVKKLEEEWGQKDDTIFTSEPYKINKLYNEIEKENLEYSETSKLFFFLLDHSLHVDNLIKPSIKKNKNIICDRYIDSRIAYQSETIEKIGIEYLENMHSWSIKPDLTILLDIKVEESKKRISYDDSFEKEDLLKKVRQNYLNMYRKKERFYKIDASQDLEDVVKECKKIIKDEIEDS